IDSGKENWSLVILNPGMGEVASLRGPGVLASSVAWSPDSRYIAVGDGHMLRVYTSLGEPVYSALLDSPITSLSWSGDLIAVGGPGEVFAVKPGGEVVWRATIGMKDVLVGSSKEVVWASAPSELNTTIYIFNVLDGSLVSKMEIPGAASSLDASPSGDYAAVATGWKAGDGMVDAVYIIDSMGSQAGYIEAKEPLEQVSWSPDGSMIAASTSNGALMILSLDGGVAWSSGALGGHIAALDWGPGMLAAGISDLGGVYVLLFQVEPGSPGDATTVTTTLTETVTSTLTMTVTNTVTLTLPGVNTTVTTTETATETVTETRANTVTREHTVTSTVTIPLTETITTTSVETVTTTLAGGQGGISMEALLLSLAILGVGVAVSLWLRRG
ncbi:MAG: hypothetical protein GSR84_06790, partial [Desulfurococcales archaeon]|nr:hypothetical protein [Desulfurococcales archaeon]